MALFRRLIFKCFAPQMVLGYRRKIDNQFLPQTRISNTTSISGEHNLDIADNVFIGHFNTLDASNGLMIGTGCQISNYVSVTTHSSHIAIRLYGVHYIEHNGRHHGYITGKTVIKAYTFIGPHSTIMPNVTLGKGSLVKAYSYVASGTYPDFAILCGNPAKVVGDTRDLDKELLHQYPELQAYYQEWK